MKKFITYWGHRFLYLEDYLPIKLQDKIAIGKRNFVLRFHKIINKAYNFGFLNYVGNTRDLSSCGLTTSYIYHLEHSVFVDTIFKLVPVDEMIVSLRNYIAMDVIFEGMYKKLSTELLSELGILGRFNRKYKEALFRNFMNVVEDSQQRLNITDDSIKNQAKEFIIGAFKLKNDLLEAIRNA